MNIIASRLMLYGGEYSRQGRKGRKDPTVAPTPVGAGTGRRRGTQRNTGGGQGNRREKTDGRRQRVEEKWESGPATLTLGRLAELRRAVALLYF